MITRAKKYGYDGIEIDGKRPHGNPLDWPTPRCRELRSIADGEGIEIFAVAANNDFSNPVPEVREAQICCVRDLIRMTADLGAPTLRVFLAWWGVTRHPQLATYDIAKGLWPIVHEKFSDRGNLGLVPRGAGRVRPLRRRRRRDAGPAESQAPHQRSPRCAADGPARWTRPHLKVCLDAPLMPDRSTAAIRQAARDGRPAAGRCRTSAASSSAGRTDRSAASTERRRRRERDEPVLPRLRPRHERDRLRRLHRATSCATSCPSSTARRLTSDTPTSNAQLAAEFMRDLIASADRREPVSASPSTFGRPA